MWVSFIILLGQTHGLAITRLPSLEAVGDYLFANHRYKEAITIYEVLHKEMPSPQRKVKIGTGLYMLGDKINSIHWLSKIHPLPPDAYYPFPEPKKILRRIYFDKGIIEVGKGNLEFALLWFERAQDKYGIGFVNYKLGNNDKAKAVFNELGDTYTVGIINYNEGYFDEALKYFTQTSSEKGIGACLYRMGKYKEALDHFEKSGEVFFAAECYYRLGKFNEAEKYYKKYLDYEVPSMIYKRDALYGLGWAYYKLEKFNSATEEFNRFISQYPEDKLTPVAMYYMGRSLLKSANTTQGISVFKDFINRYQGFEFIPNAYYWLGKAYFTISNYDSCIQSLKTLITNYMGHELCQYAYSILGNAYRGVGDYDSAIAWYSQIKSPAWLLDEARFRIEECYFELGVYGSKIDIWRNFVHKYPESSRSPRLAFEIGKHLERENKLGEAINAYNKVSQQFSWSPYATRAKLRLGDCYFRVKEVEKALESYRELLTTNLRKEALARLGDIYFSSTDYEKAIREYALLINEFPESEFAMEAHYRIGLAYEYIEKYGEARLAFGEFIEKYPDAPKLWEAWIKVAKTYWSEGLINEYEKTLTHIKTEGDGRAKQEATFLLGALYFDKGDYEYAKNYYIEAVSQSEDIDSKSMALIGAARCAKTIGKIEEAKKFYEEVIVLVPNPRLEELAKKEINELKVEENK